MSGHQSIAVWGCVVPAGDVLPAESEIPGVHFFRITMAAIDPSAKPKDATKPLRTTLKIMRRPLSSLDDWSDEEDEGEDDSSDGEEQEQLRATSKKLQAAEKAKKKAAKVAEENAMDEDDDSDDDSSSGGFETEEFVICTLDTEKFYQQPLDITISESEEVFFKVDGNFDVSLSGNYMLPVHGKGDDDDYSDSEDEDENDYDLTPDEHELIDMIGNDSEDELDDVENPRITEVESEDEEEKPTAVKSDKKLTKAEKKSLKRAAEEEPKTEEPKLSKKQLKKLKANDGKAVATGADAEAKKKVQFAKPLEMGPTNNKKDAKTTEKAPKAEKTEKKEKPVAAPAKKTVQGITIEDKKIGTGPVAKNGGKLGMRYIGKLTNGSVFDSNTKNKPFTFRLGKGEVIKGWDIGLAGMQVGGERRITIPPQMAYGSQKIPGIPPNSTLIFDVKLLEIK